MSPADTVEPGVTPVLSTPGGVFCLTWVHMWVRNIVACRRVDGIYGFFALMMLAALLCVLAGALNQQWLAGASIILLLLTLVVYAVLALAGVAVLSVGNDG